MTEANAMLASVSLIPVKVIKILPPSYKIPDPLPWAQLAGPLSLLISEFNLKRLGKNQRLFSALAVHIEAGRHATISRLQPRRLG